MRRQLIVGAAAITVTVIVAFVVPLGLAVRVLAANRPLNAAEQVAQSVATVVALTDDEQVAVDALVAAQARTDAQLTVFRRDGPPLGARAPRTPAVQRAFRGIAFAADAGDTRHIFVPAVRADGTVAVVQAAVAHATLVEGVRDSWLLLGGLAFGLLLVAVLLADSLGRSVVAATRDLADTARKVAGGDLSARVAPAGPPEVVAVGGALNGLATRITDLLATERELIADLSHRLRTPLTALRLDTDAVADPDERERLRADVDALEATVTELIREAREPSRVPPTEPIDLLPIVRERAEYWGALADEQGRIWKLDVAVDSLPILLRPQEAEALLDVLLDNVFSHTAEGTPYWISVEADRLAVEDAGDGFPERGAGGRGRSDSGSTGLGLDIARQTIERAGGQLRVLDRAPSGARVEVLLYPAT